MLPRRLFARGLPFLFGEGLSEFPQLLFERDLLILPGDRDIRTKLGAVGEYYRALVTMEERVTKWPAPRDEVEYDVLRVNVNVHTN